MPGFQIKVCGITSPADARLAVEAGADALGLNFYANSPRFLEPRRAGQIVAALAGQPVVKVGLFVNEPAEAVARVCDELGLDLVQLHGDEPPEYLRRLTGRPVMRAFRVGPAGLGPVFDYLGRCAELGAMPARVLLDSYAKGVYGGSGQSGDWAVLAQYPGEDRPPLVLAGGLGPENVATAIRAVRPAAVDVASGVELAPGRKSSELMARFVALARSAFKQV